MVNLIFCFLFYSISCHWAVSLDTTLAKQPVQMGIISPLKYLSPDDHAASFVIPLQCELELLLSSQINYDVHHNIEH